MKIQNTLLIAALICPLWWGCGGDGNQNDIEDEEVTEEETAIAPASELPENELADFKFHTFIANIPSPLETFELLKKAGVSYNDGVGNPVENRKNYTSSTSIALNYGIYMADLGYFSLNEQSQQSIKYYAASRSMAQELGFAEALDQVVSTRFQDNMNNEDSTKVIIDDAYIAMEEYLKSNEQLLTAGYIAVGGWLESQHIAVNLIDDETILKNNPVIAEKVFEQRLHIANPIIFLKEYESEQEVVDLISSLETIQAAYNELESGENVNAGSLKKIADAISAMRTGIVS